MASPRVTVSAIYRLAAPAAFTGGSCVGGYVLVARPTLAGLALLPTVAALVFLHPRLAFMAAFAAALFLPRTMSLALLIPTALAGAAAIAAGRGWRPAPADWWFAAAAAWFTATWILHPELGVSSRAFLGLALPALFYLWARLLGEGIEGFLLFAAVVAAGTVLYELAIGTVAFSDPTRYQWLASEDELFRPGGVFLGSPAAGISLAVLAVAAYPYAMRSRVGKGMLALVIAAVIATWARAGWAALAAGAIVLLLLSPRRPSWGKLAYVAAGVALVAAVSYERVVETDSFTLGVVRSQNTAARSELLGLALPLTVDSAKHFVAGRGFNAFASDGTLDPAAGAAYPLVARGGPHNEGLRTLLEQGAVGLALLAGLLAASLRYRHAAPHLAAAAIGWVTAGLFHDLGHNPYTLLVGATVLGLLVRAGCGQRLSRSSWSLR